MGRSLPHRGIDPGFPVLDSGERIAFPDPRTVPGDRPALWGANLSPGVLLSAYEQGFFPWYSHGQPLYWWSPDPRFGLPPGEAHLGKTMRKVLRQRRFEIRCDTSFSQVIRHCADFDRPGQDGTWITDEMIGAYEALFGLGYVHSVEAWQDGALVGGLYGVQIHGVFSGESMFSLVPDASKACFLHLCRFLEEDGYIHLDSQVHTDHVASLGGRELPRGVHLDLLARGLEVFTPRGSWAGRNLPAW